MGEEIRTKSEEARGACALSSRILKVLAKARLCDFNGAAWPLQLVQR